MATDVSVDLPRCDFCTIQPGYWFYPCRNFTDDQGHEWVGTWAACRSCMHAIEAEDYGELYNQTAEGYRKLTGFELPDPTAVKILHRNFFAHKQSEAIPHYRIQQKCKHPDRYRRYLDTGGSPGTYCTYCRKRLETAENPF